MECITSNDTFAYALAVNICCQFLFILFILFILQTPQTSLSAAPSLRVFACFLRAEKAGRRRSGETLLKKT